MTCQYTFLHNDITMHRFFIPGSVIANTDISVSGGVVHQIIHVLRLKPGENIVLIDDSGNEYLTEIKSLARNEVHGKVLKKEQGKGEPKIKLSICQALLRADKFEFVLQKGVELGVTNFIPFLSERCVVKKPSATRLERWQTIIKEAAEQSHRSILPELSRALSFEEACATATKPALILWEDEKSTHLASILKSPEFNKANSISIFIGPEGGFTSTEIELAKGHGIIVASLGNRILRAETVGLVAISAIMYEKGEL